MKRLSVLAVVALLAALPGCAHKKAAAKAPDSTMDKAAGSGSDMSPAPGGSPDGPPPTKTTSDPEEGGQ